MRRRRWGTGVVEALVDGGAALDAAHPFRAIQRALRRSGTWTSSPPLHPGLMRTTVAGGTPLHTAADCNQPRAIRALIAAHGSSAGLPQR